jgi:hypothetical protein
MEGLKMTFRGSTNVQKSSSESLKIALLALLPQLRGELGPVCGSFGTAKRTITLNTNSIIQHIKYRKDVYTLTLAALMGGLGIHPSQVESPEMLPDMGELADWLNGTIHTHCERSKQRATLYFVTKEHMPRSKWYRRNFDRSYYDPNSM